MSVVIASSGGAEWSWRLLLTHVRSDSVVVDLVGERICAVLASGRGTTLGSASLVAWHDGSPGGVTIDDSGGPLMCSLDDGPVRVLSLQVRSGSGQPTREVLKFSLAHAHS